MMERCRVQCRYRVTHTNARSHRDMWARMQVESIITRPGWLSRCDENAYAMSSIKSRGHNSSWKINKLTTLSLSRALLFVQVRFFIFCLEFNYTEEGDIPPQPKIEFLRHHSRCKRQQRQRNKSNSYRPLLIWNGGERMGSLLEVESRISFRKNSFFFFLGAAFRDFILAFWRAVDCAAHTWEADAARQLAWIQFSIF